MLEKDLSESTQNVKRAQEIEHLKEQVEKLKQDSTSAGNESDSKSHASSRSESAGRRKPKRSKSSIFSALRALGGDVEKTGCPKRENTFTLPILFVQHLRKCLKLAQYFPFFFMFRIY